MAKHHIERSVHTRQAEREREEHQQQLQFEVHCVVCCIYCMWRWQIFRMTPLHPSKTATWREVRKMKQKCPFSCVSRYSCNQFHDTQDYPCVRVVFSLPPFIWWWAGIWDEGGQLLGSRVLICNQPSDAINSTIDCSMLHLLPLLAVTALLSWDSCEGHKKGTQEGVSLTDDVMSKSI